jgi:filamentous hemagglutinin family protein
MNLIAKYLLQNAANAQIKSFLIIGIVAIGTHAITVFATQPANTLPYTPVVTSGNASITNPSAGVMNINQSTNKASINWSTFNIGSSAQVNITQPSSSAVLLNRITGGSASLIEGALTANGQVILINPNGITFGRGSQVSSAGTIVSTLDISDEAFNNASQIYTFSGNSSSGSITNYGSLTTNDPSGYIALIAPQITNEGAITARIGAMNTIALASGENVTLQFEGRQLLGVNLNKASLQGMINDRGAIELDGGTLIFSAASASQIYSSTINDSGLLSADAMSNNSGQISLKLSNSSLRNENEVVNSEPFSSSELISFTSEVSTENLSNPESLKQFQLGEKNQKSDDDRNKGREHEKKKGKDDDYEHEHDRDHDKDKDHEHDRDHDKDKDHEHDRDHDKDKDHGHHKKPIPAKPLEPPVVVPVTPLEPPVVIPAKPLEPPVVVPVTPLEPPVVVPAKPLEPPVVVPVIPLDASKPIGRSAAGCSLFIDRTGVLINNCESPKR